MTSKNQSSLFAFKLTATIICLLILSFDYPKDKMAHASSQKIISDIDIPLSIGIIKKYTLEDQQIINDQFEITSTDSEFNQQFQISVLESTTTQTGRLSATTKGSIRNQNSPLHKIITFEESEFILTPNTTKTINFQIQNQILPPGIYSAAIAIESRNINANRPQNNQYTGLQIASRTIYNILLEIPGQKLFDFTLDPINYQFNNNQITLNQKITNSGNSILAANSEITFTSLFTQKTTTRQISTNLFTQNSHQISESIAPHLPIDLFTIEYSLQLAELNPSDNSKSTPQIFNHQSTHLFLSQSTKITILILIALSITFITFKIRQKRQTTLYKVSKNDTIEKIAKKHNTTWQKIIKINKLKPPFILRENDIISIPQSKTRQLSPKSHLKKRKNSL